MTIICAKPRQRTFTTFKDAKQAAQWLLKNPRKLLHYIGDSGECVAYAVSKDVVVRHGRIIINHFV